jgi:DNA polymerase III alpha subunit (gram-positive type)
VAHNAAFDAEFLAQAIKKHGIRMPGNPVVDSIKLSRKVLMEAGSHALGNLAKKLKNEINIQLNNSELHRALYDCEVLKEVFTACLRKRFQDKELAMDKAVQSIEKLHGPILQFKSFV